jgi:hypothetical protein
MDAREMRDWITFHGDAFEDFGRLAANIDRETYEGWRGAMVGTTLDAATEASKLMIRGELKRPYKAEDHVPAIAAKARSITTASIPPRDTRLRSHQCPLCLDTAFITVLSPQTVQRAQEGGTYDAYAAWLRDGKSGQPPARPKWYTCALWCGCSIGSRQRGTVEEASRSDSMQASWARVPVFDPDRHVRVGHELEQVIDAAKAIVVRPANYVSDFGDWNRQVEEVGF